MRMFAFMIFDAGAAKFFVGSHRRNGSQIAWSVYRVSFADWFLRFDAGFKMKD